MNFIAFVILAAGLIAFLKYIFYDCNFDIIKNDSSEIEEITSIIKEPEEKQQFQDDVDTPYVFLSFSENGKEIGDISIKLYEKDCPITTKNFKELCCSYNPAFGYKNSIIHRNIHNFMVQGGDFTHGNGTGGESIYHKKFKDENFKYRNKKGTISMANVGPNTNGSQFFLNVVDNEGLDGKHVVFGKIIDGMELVEYINSRPVDNNDRPLHDIVISACGRLWTEESDEPFYEIEPGMKDKYTSYLENL